MVTGPIWGQDLGLSPLPWLCTASLTRSGTSFHQEQGGQPAVLNQGIVSFLYRNRAFGEKKKKNLKPKAT